MRAAAVATILTGGMILLGWGLDIAFLKDPLPGYIRMKANGCAVCLILGGLALLRSPRSAIACASLMAAISGLTLVEYALGVDLGIDQFLFGEPPGAIGTVHPNRMAPNTVLGFVLLGSALGLIAARRFVPGAQSLALAAAAISIAALVGYAFGVPNAPGRGRAQSHRPDLGGGDADPGGGRPLRAAGPGPHGLYHRRHGRRPDGPAAPPDGVAAHPGGCPVPVGPASGALRHACRVVLWRPSRAAFCSSRSSGGMPPRSTAPTLSASRPRRRCMRPWIGWRTALQRGPANFRMPTRDCGPKSPSDSGRSWSFAARRNCCDLAHDTIMVLDLQGRITFWNKGAERMYGWTSDEALGQVSYDLLRTEFPGTFEEHKAELMRRGYWEGELIHQPRDGAPIVAASRWVLQREERDGPMSILEINNDVTRRRRAEEALKESEGRYRALVEVSPQMVWMAGADGSIVFVNQYGLDYIGLTTEEARGDGWLEAVHSDHRERVLSSWHRAIRAGEDYCNEFLIRRAEDGVCRWQAVRGRPIRDDVGKIVKWLGVAIDIDDRKRAEQELQEREARLRTILDTTLDGIITIDDHGLIDSFNPAAGCLFGFRPEEVIGNNISLLMSSPDREQHDDHMARYRRTGESTIIGTIREVSGQRKDGSIFPLELAVSEMRVAGKACSLGSCGM